VSLSALLTGFATGADAAGAVCAIADAASNNKAGSCKSASFVPPGATRRIAREHGSALAGLELNCLSCRLVAFFPCAGIRKRIKVKSRGGRPRHAKQSALS